MDRLQSILVVIDPSDRGRHVLAKATALARCFDASLELFLCDSERAFALRHAYDPTGVAEAERDCLRTGQERLESIRSALPKELRVSIHVACESPLYEAIVRRVKAVKPDLVMKSAAGQHPDQPFTLDTNDWELARTCPVPVMFTRGRPWTAQSRFVAAVDLGEGESREVARAILRVASALARGSGAGLDVVYSRAAAADSATAERHREELRELVREHAVGCDQMHVLTGEPEETLPAFGGQGRYDMMVVGALTQRESVAALVGTLTGKLVDALDCDFVLVKSESYQCPIENGREATTGVSDTMS